MSVKWGRFKIPAEAISLGTSTLWVTHGKTFETWICPLAHLLCGYCTDVILRLCQEIVFLKVEVVELLLPSIFVNLARRRDLDIDIQQLISLQVFWLSIDYLAVAKSAVLPQHIEILISAVTHINEPNSLYGIILSNKVSNTCILSFEL
ncbi:serine/threonine-protein kinase ATM-like isoform X2 [Humulus lupulus]|uniref:serine/threonine-protein kinase ATM-like isoform X2 n=1 Tax=Humulus lupulus TaxID=3486 RepID=UPI002B40932B|nr:serine/threonine-protein kinase ATM-like isoform X2 [Humulus lupulus]